MAVVSSASFNREVQMTDRVAKEDIIVRNDLGQNVVVVAAGQPIPEGVDVPKSKTAPESQAADIVPDTATETTAAPRKSTARKSSARKRSR